MWVELERDAGRVTAIAAAMAEAEEARRLSRRRGVSMVWVGCLYDLSGKGYQNRLLMERLKRAMIEL